MTNGEAAGYLAIVGALVITTLGVVVLLSFALIEPSLWRLGPPIVWLLFLRNVLIPRLAGHIAPADLARRWAVFEGGESSSDPRRERR